MNAAAAAQEPASPHPGVVTVICLGLGAPGRPRARVVAADWPDVLGAYQRAVTRIVSEYGGTAVELDGDRVVACFGCGRAADSGGPDALAAALDLVRAVDRLSANLPPRSGAADLRARVGVRTGPAARKTGGTGRDGGEASPLADLIEAASRLRAEAGPGEVLADEVTARHAGARFELVAVELGGAEAGAGTTAYRVAGARPARSRRERRSLAPFVGRRPELEWLDRHWRAAAEGPARAVLVVGEPGVGKSRLVAEFASAVAAGGARVVALACQQTSALSPLHPFGPVMEPVPETPEAAAAWLRSCAAAGPTLVLVEDSQWADPSTAEALKRASRAELAMLIVCTARPHPLDGRGGWPDPATRLVLDRLDADSARTIVEHVLGHDRVGRGLVEDLVERAEGVPLYLEELARNITAQDRAYLSAVPPSLQDVIVGRLERLGQACRVARMASVIGRDFDRSLLRDLCRLDEGTLNRHLRRLAEHAIVDGPDRPDGPLCFRHALIHQAAYQSLTPDERARAHSFVADALAGSGQSATDPQLAAHHLTAAGRYGEAVAMWRAAARTARRHSRFKEAAGHEREILSLLPYLEDDHRDSVELKARSRLAMCLTAVDQGAPEVLGEALRAQDLARAYGDERTVLDTYLILLPWWQARAEYGSIDAVLPEVRRLSERVGEPAYGYALSMVEASVRIWEGSLADGLRQLGEMFERVGIPLRESLRTIPPVSAPTVLMRSSSRVAAALGFWLTGDARSAWRLVDDALAFATEREVTAARAVVCATAALMAQLDGDPGRASDFAAQAERAPEESATLQWRRWGAALRRWADGRPSEIRVPGRMLAPYFLMLSADDPALPAEEAVGLLDRALAEARASGERFCEAELLRSRARAWLRAGRPEAAGSDLLAAGDTARAQLARSLELRALTDRVALLDDHGARSRLERLVATLGVDGPARSVEAARRALGRSDPG